MAVGGPDGNDLVGRHANLQRAAMYYAKIDTGRIDLVQQLGSSGFYVVDVQVTLHLTAQGHTPVPTLPVGVTVGDAELKHQEEVLKIAASCFRYSRFHLDPGFSLDKANRIKRDWVLSYFRKERGERLWVALKHRRPVAFAAILASSSNGSQIRAIDLIGVDPLFQGQGIGKALVGFCVAQYQDRCDELQVGTQIANVPSIRLYEGLGFSLVKADYCMHRHVEDKSRLCAESPAISVLEP